jgi:hypothetical protein
VIAADERSASGGSTYVVRAADGNSSQDLYEDAGAVRLA